MATQAEHDHLEAVLVWAKARLATGAEPPWAWYQYMKLIEAIEAVQPSLAAVTTVESSEAAPRQDRHLRLVGPGDQQDTAQPHPAGLPVQLPM